MLTYYGITSHISEYQKHLLNASKSVHLISVQFSSFIYFCISRIKYNDIDLNKKNTHNNRFYDFISSINSIKEEPLSSKDNIKRPPVKCNHIYLGYIRVEVVLLSNERRSDISCTVVSKVP